MNILSLMILICFFSLSMAQAGIWSRIDEQSIRFDGPIKSGDFEGLEALLGKDDKTLFVDSTGGDVEVGLLIGFRLLPFKLRVVVDGLCVSSCANYIFAAGDIKEIRKGFVGFHGNATAVIFKYWGESVRDAKEEGMTDEEIEQVHLKLLELSKREQEFFATLGIQQDLFDRSQSEDKGMNNGESYHFLCPTPQTFKKYGFLNVQGQQDITYAPEIEMHNLLD